MKRRIANDKGAGLPEYGLAVALLVLVAIPSTKYLGWRVEDSLACSSLEMSASGSPQMLNQYFGSGMTCDGAAGGLSCDPSVIGEGCGGGPGGSEE